MAGSSVKASGGLPYSERNAVKGKRIDHGHDLMEYFLKS
jgi:hypothetical protein